MPYFDCSYRVPYADTDQMQVVYYANYLEYFERSRTEMLRSVGLPYSEMEKLGFFLPVSEAHCKYFSSAHYDELLTFRSYVLEDSRVRVKLGTEVRRDGEVLARGYVTLGCVNKDFKISRLPQELMECCERCSYDPENEK